jgi:hypothetical protein
MSDEYIPLHTRHYSTVILRSKTKPGRCPTCGAKTVIPNGGYFRVLRLRAGLSLREVAKRLRISAAYLSDMELGRRAFHPKYISNYEAALSLATIPVTARWRKR